MESVEQLKAENERLLSEMASMKKKIKLALKKQQAEHQAKIQAAEQRAIAAEAASGAYVNGTLSRTNSEILATHNPARGGNGILSFTSSPYHPLSSPSSNGGIGHPSSPPTLGDSGLPEASAELKAERQNSFGEEEDAVEERQRLENEVIELRKTADSAVKQREDERAKFDTELSLVKEDAEQRVGLLTKENKKLEAQLIGAADQVAEAFARMSCTQDDMERTSREVQEYRSSHASLATDYESVCRDLKLSQTALFEAQHKLLEKAKEIQDMAAARKSAQEGQEAAMSQLMHRLDEMEAAAPGQEAEHLREAHEDKVQSLLQVKADLQRKLETSADAILLLQEEISAYKERLLVVEATSTTSDISDAEITISNLKTHNASLLEEIRSQSGVVKCLQEELQMLRTGQQQTSSPLPEMLSLNSQLESMAASQLAAENQIKRLSVACNDGERLIEKLTQEIANAHRNLDEEIKIRDNKYSELDAKFGRLQKRAKQRIQEVQKEKEEAESQLASASEKTAQALSRQTALQDDLDRVKFQTAEALRALDADRQQLRVANIKLRDEIEDLSRTLHAKEHNLAESRRLASEKDQAALELTASLKEIQANHETALLDIKDKHRKIEDSFKAQLADVSLENSKMSETISAIQAELSVKESKFAELDAVSSGEIVRLGASLEASKREALRLELEHKTELEVREASSDKLRRRLEESEKEIFQQELAMTELRSQMESELEWHRKLLGNAHADLAVARKETACVMDDLAAYKVRAYALLQKKEAALLAAKDSELAAAQEIALKDAKRGAVQAAMERDAAVKSLRDAVSEYENKLSARDISVLDAEQRIRDLATKLEACKGQRLSEQFEWQHSLAEVESMWREKCEMLEAKVAGSKDAGLKLEYTALKTDYSKLKMEFDSFRDLVDTMIEEKDKEIGRLLEENANLQRSTLPQSRAQSEDRMVHASELPDLDSAVAAIAEQQILVLARQQAQREEEVSQCRRHIQALQEEITDLEQENRLHSQQEALLKEELRSLERSHKRDGLDMTYLKNVILKLLETGEVEALLPVVAMLLQFSPDELKRCNDTYNTGTNTPISGAAAVVDSAVSTPRNFFSRLNFTGGN